MIDVEGLHQDAARFDRAMRYRPGDSKSIERRYMPHVVTMIQAAGIDRDQITRCGHGDPVDLVIGGLGIEVKISRNQGKRPHYYKALLRDHTNHHYLNGDFVLMVCVLPGPEFCVFVIPTWAIGDRKTIEITSDPWQYRGQWAWYRDRWDLLQS